MHRKPFPHRVVAIYRAVMSDSLSPDEIRAAAEVHDELGPGYRDAVIESFLERVGKEIDARVDARLDRSVPASAPEERGRGHRHPGRSERSGSPLALAICSLVFGIPITAIVLAVGGHQAGLVGLVVVWVAIAVINIAYNTSYAARYRFPPQDRR